MEDTLGGGSGGTFQESAGGGGSCRFLEEVDVSFG